MGDAPGHQEPARVLERRRELRHARLSRSFLILHGLEGSGPDHWQTWLAGRLRRRGEDVSYPALPEPFDPQPDAWLAVLRDELARMRGERIVLCHSLGCLLWLLHARDGGDAADRVVLVAPPCTEEIPAVVRFRPDGVGAEHVRRAGRITCIVCAPEGDPYCQLGAQNVFGHLDTRIELVTGGEHLNVDAGFGPWQWIEDWALGAS